LVFFCLLFIFKTLKLNWRSALNLSSFFVSKYFMTFHFSLSLLSLFFSLPSLLFEDFISILFPFLHFPLYIHNLPATFLFFQVRPALMYQCKFILYVLIFVRAQLVLSLSPPLGCPFWVKMCKLGYQSCSSRLKDWFFLSPPNKLVPEFK
jgi:hypothetical protein